MRHDDREALTKADLQSMLGASVDSIQLNEAFENLDVDGDGEISLDEFLAGFARFLCEVPHTGSTKPMSAAAQLGLLQRRSLLLEDQFVYDCGSDVADRKQTGWEKEQKPSEEFQQSLIALSSHNRSLNATIEQALVAIATLTSLSPSLPPSPGTALRDYGEASLQPTQSCWETLRTLWAR